MKKWFKKMYYDKDYQDVTTDYFKDVLNKFDDNDGICYRGDTSVWTGKQEIGNRKKTTIEDLEKQLKLVNKKLELMKAADEEEKDIETGQKKNDAGNVPQSPAVPTTGPGNTKA